jgi:hypothetical protein
MKPRTIRAAIAFTLFSTSLLAFAAGATAPSARATNNPQAAAPATDALTAFRFLVGLWQAQPDPAKPSKYVETMNYAAIHDGRFLTSQEIWRDKDGKIIYKDFAVFGVDPDTHQLFLHAYNTDGSIDRTRGIDSPANQWIFLGTVYGSPNFKDYRYTLTKIDDDHIRVLIELSKNGTFQKYNETLYERKSHDSNTGIQ